MNSNFVVFDAHCDTVGEMYEKCTLAKSKGHLDIERMMNYSGWAQVFACWYDGKHGVDVQKQKHFEIIERFYKELEKNKKKIYRVTKGKDILDVVSKGKIAAILGVEGADWIEHEADVELLYEKGIRVLTLTWNYANKLAGGAGEGNESVGLTKLGGKVIEKMNQLGMLIDVSHINEKSFWGVMEKSKKPIAATHSNAKAICNHNRNLTDEQFCALIRNGGVVGINYYPIFLSSCKKATVDDIIKHIEHFCGLGGQDNVGLGGDFDGVDFLPEGMAGAEDVGKIAERLLSLNYSENLVEKIFFKNFNCLFEKVIF